MVLRESEKWKINPVKRSDWYEIKSKEFFEFNHKCGWNIFLLIVGVSLLFNILLLLAIAPILYLSGENFDILFKMTTSTVFSLTTIMFLYLFIKYKKFNPIKVLSLKRTDNLFTYLYVILPVTALFILRFVFLSIAGDFSLNNFNYLPQFIFMLNFNVPTFIGFLILFIVLVVFPSIVQELLFRGYILNAFSKNYKPETAIILSAVLFSTLSIGNIANIVSAFLFGIYAGLVVYKTKSIYPAMLAHYIYTTLILFTYLPYYYFS